MNCLRLLLVCAVAIWAGHAEGEARRGTEAEVVVIRLSESIPESPQEAETFVWDHFSKRPEIDLFQHYSTNGWRPNYDLFAQALVSKAKKAGFEHEALEAELKKLLTEPVNPDGDEVAYLPIGAYRTRQGAQEAWIILCLWEVVIDPSKTADYFAPSLAVKPAKPAKQVQPAPKRAWLTVGHIRMFTYDIATGTLIGYVTCD